MQPRRRRDSNLPLPGREHLIDRPTERDRLIFQLLEPSLNFKYLTTSWLHYFAHGEHPSSHHKKNFSYRLGHLRAEPNRYILWPEQQKASPNVNYKDAVYSLAPKGERTIAIPSIRSGRSNSYLHELLVDLAFHAPLRYAVDRDPALRLIPAAELLKHPRVPQSTRDSNDPFQLHLPSKEKHRFDGTPFILDRDGRHICIPGIEVDRRTENIRLQNDISRSALGKHIDRIIEFVEKKIYTRHWGFDNCIIPIMSTNETHTLNAMAYLKSRRPTCSYIIFQTIPDIGLLDHFPNPNGEILTTPWRRVGHADFTLATFA